VGADIGGDDNAIDQATLRTGTRMGLMFGDNGGQRGEFGDLMPGGFRIVGSRFGRQRRLTVGAGPRDIDNDGVNPRLGQAEPLMSPMSGLPAASSAGRSLDDRLGSVEGIGRRRRGAIGRVSMKLSEKFFNLSFKYGDPGQCRFEHGDPSQRLIELATKLGTFEASRA
jgi:hypothetical protein